MLLLVSPTRPEGGLSNETSTALAREVDPKRSWSRRRRSSQSHLVAGPRPEPYTAQHHPPFIFHPAVFGHSKVMFVGLGGAGAGTALLPCDRGPQFEKLGQVGQR